MQPDYFVQEQEFVRLFATQSSGSETTVKMMPIVIQVAFGDLLHPRLYTLAPPNLKCSIPIPIPIPIIDNLYYSFSITHYIGNKLEVCISASL